MNNSMLEPVSSNSRFRNWNQERRTFFANAVFNIWGPFFSLTSNNGNDQKKLGFFFHILITISEHFDEQCWPTMNNRIWTMNFLPFRNSTHLLGRESSSFQKNRMFSTFPFPPKDHIYFNQFPVSCCWVNAIVTVVFSSTTRTNMSTKYVEYSGLTEEEVRISRETNGTNALPPAEEESLLEKVKEIRKTETESKTTTTPPKKQK